MKTQFQLSKQLLNALNQNYEARLRDEATLAGQLAVLFNATEKQILNNLKDYEELPPDFYSILSPLDDLRIVYSQLIAQTNEKHFINGYGRNATLINLMKSEFNFNTATKAINIERGSDFFGIDEKVLENIKNKSFVASQGVMDRVNTNISKNLAKSYTDGVGIDNAARSLQKEFTKLKGYEATRIARTEINSAQNEGAFQAYYDFNINYHQWWTGQDARVRDSHRAIHGQITKVGSAFGNGLTRPGDRSGSKKEWIHCRCTTVPYLMPWGMMAPPGATTFFEKDLIPIPGITQPQNFKQINNLDDYVDTRWSNQLKNVTKDEAKAILDYQKDSAFINHFLRTGEIKSGSIRASVMGETAYKKELQTQIRLITNAIDKSPLPEDLTIYAGVGNDFPGLNSLKVGSKIRSLRGFRSTSTDRWTAESFSDNTIFEIEYPTGSRGLPVNKTLKQNKLEPHRNEDEILLSDNTSWEVIDIYENGGYNIIKLKPLMGMFRYG